MDTEFGGNKWSLLQTFVFILYIICSHCFQILWFGRKIYNLHCLSSAGCTPGSRTSGYAHPIFTSRTTGPILSNSIGNWRLAGDRQLQISINPWTRKGVAKRATVLFHRYLLVTKVSEAFWAPSLPMVTKKIEGSDGLATNYAIVTSCSAIFGRKKVLRESLSRLQL